MHRKAIAASLTSGQCSEAINSLRHKDSAALLLLSKARFPCNRKSPLKFLISTFVCLFSAVSLFAKPDPDLFDGRVTTRSYDSESGSTAGSSDSGGSEGGEQRDIESVGGPLSSEAVGSIISKDGSISEGGRESSGSTLTPPSDSTVTTSKDGASFVGGGSGSRPTTELSGAQSGGSGFGSQVSRNFEDFGFGGGGAQETVDVNRSKESTTSVSLLSDNRTIPREGNNFTSAAGQEASGGTRAGNLSLDGDYGTNLPSGL